VCILARVQIPPLLDALLRAHGPTGHEQLAYDVVREAVGDLAEVESDTVGSLIARRRGTGEGLHLALYAHLDVVGLAVAHIGEDGLLSVHTLGVWRANVAYGQRVEIATARGRVTGVIARRTKDAEKVEWDQLYLDIGARDADEARSLVAPGDPIVVVAPPVELANGRVASRSLDDRAGLYVALEALKRLAADGVGLDLSIVAAAHEELGASGAGPATHALEPDLALVLDVTYASDVPSGDPNESGRHVLGGGPAIFRGPAVNPHVFELLVRAAEAEGIPYSVETGMRTHSDADDTYLSREGVATGLVSLPLRHMHSPIETVELADLDNCIRLVVAFARLLEPGLNLAR